jgi:hypothetical protein
MAIVGKREGTAMRKVVGTVAAAGAALVTLLVAPTAAHAATCYGNGCINLDPEATGCAADATTPRSVVTSGRTVELRYSPTCRAAWGRVRNAAAGDTVFIHSSAGTEERATVGSGATSAYTRMLGDAGLTAYACLYLGGCTGSY